MLGESDAWGRRVLTRAVLSLLFCLSSLMGVCVSADASISVRGPVAAYSFDEGEGETVEDLTGDGHTATIEGASWSTQGRYGGAMEFDASEEDVLKVPDSPELDFSEEFTLEAWVHPSGEESSWAPIIAKQQGGGKGAHRYAYWLHESWEGANYPAGGFETSTEGQDREAGPSEHLSENHWTHLAITFDGAKLRLYVDGELVKDESTTGMAQLTEGDLQIGGSTEHGDFFNGRIDEVRIYNRALSEQEVRPDVTPPTSPKGFSAILEDEESGDATLSWNTSSDPAFPDGYPGTGVAEYVYRYHSEGKTWTEWLSTGGPIAEVPEVSEGQKITVEATAFDGAGNQSPVVISTVEATPTMVTAETIGEDEEEAPREEAGEITIVHDPERIEPSNPEKGPHPLFLNEEKLCEGRGGNPCGIYNHVMAAEYALKWAFPESNSAEVDKKHNHEFQYFGSRGGDCTNFASQALWWGGMEFMRTYGHNSPDMNAHGEENFESYEYGQGSWWSAYYYFGHHPPKHFAPPTRSWAEAHALFEHLTEYHLAKVISHSERPKVGDLVFYNQGEGSGTQNIDHVQIISRVKKHYVQVVQHTESYKKAIGKVFNKLEHEFKSKAGVNWNYFVVEPIHTAANIDE
jgi:hypothetical protein